MKLLLNLLSSITIFYGITFTNKQSKIIQLIGFIFFIIFNFNQIVFSYDTYYDKDRKILQWIGSQTYHLGSFVFGWSIVIKGKSMVDYMMKNNYLMTKSQYKFILCYTLFIIIIFVFDWIIISKKVFFYLLTVDKLFSRETFYFWLAMFTYPCNQWLLFSSLIYGIMYFLMHLNHMKLLQNLTNLKYYSYSTFYRTLTTVQSDYENFDDLFSLFPGSWLVHILLSINCFISLVRDGSFHNEFTFTILLIKEFAFWILVLFFVNVLRSKFIKKIQQVKYFVATVNLIDETKGHSIIQLMDKMCDINVTAGHFCKLDKGLILPFIGSLLTYTFLFMEF